MGLISNWLKNRKTRYEKKNNDCEQLLMELCEGTSNIDNLFSDFQDFIYLKAIDFIHSKWGYLLDKVSLPKINHLKKTNSYKFLLMQIKTFSTSFYNLHNNISNYNKQVAQGKVNNGYSLIGDVEGRKLDFQQMLSIVKESYNHLVIAGAGTGKTTTIVGRIKYLLKSEKCLSDEILVLSFTNASASEMKDRIYKETGETIETSTFHKLGLNIIASVNGINPKITKISLKNLITEQLKVLIQNQDYLKNLATYLLYNKVIAKNEFDFKTQKEYDNYLSMNPPTTLNNEIVKSYGEMDIANFLKYNCVNYIYETPYEFDTRTTEFSQYHPDFYLPDYGIYIEYYGIDKDGNVPDYFFLRN